MNLHRTPFGGRHFECFSEDPLLTARIGVAYVRGLQTCGVGATVKHFVGNDSETERMTVEVRIDERPLRELYLAPFEAIVREAGAWAVMAAYHGVNGSTVTESPLLRGILHDEWGYDGLVMSDWTAARSTEPAARAALDLAMPGPASRFGPWGDALVAAVQGGRVAEALTTWPASQDGLPSAQPADGVLGYTEGLFIGYRGYDRDGREPLFPFGHGHGYTTWSYESITVDCAPVNPPGTPGVAVCVEVRNTGPRRGREIVQVYASRPDSAVERPVKWLAGFAAVDADPGETVHIGIMLPERAFQHWSDGGWTLEAGTFTLAAGSSSASLPLTGGVTLK